MSTLLFKVVVPDAKENEVLSYFVRSNGYTDLVPDKDGNQVPNPESVQDAAQRFMANYVAEHYKAYIVKLGVDAARAKGLDDAGKVVITKL